MFRLIKVHEGNRLYTYTRAGIKWALRLSCLGICPAACVHVETMKARGLSIALVPAGVVFQALALCIATYGMVAQ